MIRVNGYSPDQIVEGYYPDFTTSWKMLLKEIFKETKESFSKLDKITLTQEELKEYFHGGYAEHRNIKPFRAWSANYVYFSVEYDGKVSVAYVHRNPIDKKEKIEHITGRI